LRPLSQFVFLKIAENRFASRTQWQVVEEDIGTLGRFGFEKHPVKPFEVHPIVSGAWASGPCRRQ
jgi:hypothetical protein